MLKRGLFALLPMLLPLLAWAGCSRALRVPFEDWQPYSFIDAQGQHTGLETELLAAVAREAGCSVTYVREVPRNRRLRMLTGGELDLLLAATPSPSPDVWYTRPYREERFGVFMREGDTPPAARTLDELLKAGLHLITHRGPVNMPVVNEFNARGLTTGFEDYAKGVQLLQLQRGDLLLGDSVAITYAAHAAGVRLVELPIPVLHDAVAYKLSRKSLTDADRQTLDQAIQRLELRGELQHIRERWLGPLPH